MPLSRRRNPRRALNTALPNSSANSSTPTIHTLRRLQSKPKTVKWSNSNNDNPNNDTTGINESIDSQQQRRTTQNDESFMVIGQNDTDMTPSAMIVTILENQRFQRRPMF